MFEMRFGGALRHQQAKDQVDRVTVMGVVVERMPKAYERADAVVDAGHAAMRNRHAVTQAGTAELFACREAAKDIAGIEVAGACQQLRQLLKRLLLAGEGMPLADAVRGQDLGDFHVLSSDERRVGKECGGTVR